VPEIAYRRAELAEAAEIFDAVKELAPEIPLLLDTLEREEALYAATRSCARSGESWLAVDAAGRIVGFALVEPSQLRRHYAEHEVLELRYAGVVPAHRNQGIFGNLLGRVLERMLPVAITVSPANQSPIARRLAASGFRKTASPAGVQQFRWEPGRTP
jgi:GNAT superfamily N-acetyltransferase